MNFSGNMLPHFLETDVCNNSSQKAHAKSRWHEEYYCFSSFRACYIVELLQLVKSWKPPNEASNQLAMKPKLKMLVTLNATVTLFTFIKNYITKKTVSSMSLLFRVWELLTSSCGVFTMSCYALFTRRQDNPSLTKRVIIVLWLVFFFFIDMFYFEADRVTLALYTDILCAFHTKEYLCTKNICIGG